MEPRYEDHAHHISQLGEAIVAAADPYAAVRKHLQRNGQKISIGSFNYDLDQGRVFVISVGKAAVPMGLAAAEILADALTAALLATKRTDRDWQSELTSSILSDRPSTVALFQAGHPISDEHSVAAAHAAIELLANTRPGDLVIFLISGGTSAILSDPLIPLNEWQQLNKLLISSGCSISEMNCVRQQLDRVKGGGLAAHAAPAQYYTLILSDVVGNPISSIGSGPTIFNQDVPADAIAILTRYGLNEKIKPAIWKQIITILDAESTDRADEQQSSPCMIIGDVRQAAQAALIRAAKLGFVSQIVTTRLQGEAREVAHVIAAIAQDLPPGRCAIFGGETTVTLRGKGRGGRNLETALAAAIDIEGCSGLVVACFATDGEDGTTDAAGALATGSTVALARSVGLSAASLLEANDSYTFFDQLGKLHVQMFESREDLAHGPVRVNHIIHTGPTGTNVNDLAIVLKYRVPDEQA